MKSLKQICKSYSRFSRKKTTRNTLTAKFFFLATCSQFFFSSKNDINYDIAIKLRPNGGLIGIDNSSLNKYLNDLIILRLHATLLDAARIVHKVNNTGPTFCHMLAWKCNNSLIGHLSGITFCLYVKLKKPILTQLLEF